MPPRVALIHAVTVAMDPIKQAFAAQWPEALCSSLLDDSLSGDLERDGGLTPAMHVRIAALADYAGSTGADAILFTCSAFGAAIEEAAARFAMPVLKPNEAMFEAALDAGDRVGMLATFGPSVDGMEQEFRTLAAERGHVAATIKSICVPDALTALRSGDTDTHNRLLAEAGRQLQDCDVVLLAHFSTARAESAVRSAVRPPVYSAPGAAVAKLKRLVSRSAE